MTFEKIAIIGFGEAGPVFASGFVEHGISTVTCYDILIEDHQTQARQEEKANAIGVVTAYDRVSAVSGADLVLSTVTADRAVEAAEQVAPYLKEGQFYLDLNSSSPDQKKAAANFVAANGAVFVEGVAMDTVPLKGFQTPLLLSGPASQELCKKLKSLGMEVEAVGAEYGQACSVKLIRSVIIKGLEALFAESMAAAGKVGVADRILDTLYVTFPGLDWRQVAGYHLSRLAIHGRRRAAELRASAATLRSLGISPIMAEAIAERHQWSDDIGLKDLFADSSEPSVNDFIEAVTAAGEYQ